MVRLPDQGTTRRIVTDWIVAHRHFIRPPVLEVGCARPKNAWWADFQQQLDMQGEEWLGVDMQPSDCTDLEWDMTDRLVPHKLYQHFNSCICAETLEHVTEPQKMLWSIRHCLVPGSWVVITVPFAFPPHGFPHDYWRFTGEGLKLLLRNEGYVDIICQELDRRDFLHTDHERTEVMTHRKLPTWMGAIARTRHEI